MPQTVRPETAEIILADVAPPPSNEAGHLEMRGDPVNIVWLIALAIAVFALVFFGLKRYSNSKRR